MKHTVKQKSESTARAVGRC